MMPLSKLLAKQPASSDTLIELTECLVFVSHVPLPVAHFHSLFASDSHVGRPLGLRHIDIIC